MKVLRTDSALTAAESMAIRALNVDKQTDVGLAKSVFVLSILCSWVGGWR